MTSARFNSLQHNFYWIYYLCKCMSPNELYIICEFVSEWCSSQTESSISKTNHVWFYLTSIGSDSESSTVQLWLDWLRYKRRFDCIKGRTNLCDKSMYTRADLQDQYTLIIFRTCHNCWFWSPDNWCVRELVSNETIFQQK